MAKQRSHSVKPTYQSYISDLKDMATTASAETFPKVIALFGPSDFLRFRGAAILESTWSKLDPSEPRSIEASELDEVGFRSLWAQVSLFDPESLYVIRRADKNAKIATWLKAIPSNAAMRSRIVIDFGEKIPAEANRQMQRLEARIIPCVEPESLAECGRVVSALAKRQGIQLADDGVRLLLDSMGLDLAKLDNEVRKLGLVFHGRKTPIPAQDLASIVGHLREDHVFELFHLLRARQRAKAQLLVEHLLDRGEKAIALVGILSRFARELIAKKPHVGTKGLALCARADVTLKSTSRSEVLVLAGIVDTLTEI